MTTHLPAPTAPAKPLCGRVLSRNLPLTQRDQSTMLTGLPAPSPLIAPESLRAPRLCHHCQRVAGLIPPLTRPTRNSEGDQEDSWDVDQTDEGNETDEGEKE